MQHTGIIKSIKGNIVEVEFQEAPSIFDIVILESDPTIQMEVYSSSTASRFFCLSLSSTKKLKRGYKVVNTQTSLKIPVGNETLGRVMDIFGNPQDNKGPISTKNQQEIQNYSNDYSELLVPSTILETGIKAIDFFSPL
ncbi:hypothetical protein H0W32_02860, partial [Patescibacteria group bacterium]|nr:hypothetical protein [Patescibacteria group bacterium]